MKKNPKLESIRKRIPADVKRMIDHSFAVIERIDKIMTQKGISQKELATRLGKRESEVSKWMRGTQNFTFKTIAKLEIALGEPIVEIAKAHPGIFVMQVTNGPSKMFLAVQGVKDEVSNSGQIYKTANGSESVSYELAHQLN